MTPPSCGRGPGPPRGVRLDRALADAERLGDLGLAHVQVVAQDDHFLLPPWQVAHGPAQGAVAVVGDHRGLGGVNGAHRLAQPTPVEETGDPLLTQLAAGAVEDAGPQVAERVGGVVQGPPPQP